MSFEPFVFIVEKVGQLLVDEVMYLATDKDELLERLRRQLELAQSFVRDVENQKQQLAITHVLDTTSQHINQIIPQFEDYLDELFFKKESEEIRQLSSIRKFVACLSCCSNPLVRRHVVIDRASKLISDLEGILERAKAFEMPSNIPQVTRRRALQTLPNIMNEEFIVGLDEDVENLVAKLSGANGKRRAILGIVGMGGSGKTTLARKLYNHEEVNRQFIGCLAWVCVSQGWDASKLLREICAQLHIPLMEGESSSAGLKVQEFLRTSPCFVVLDDVWKTTALRELVPLLLPSGGREGRGGVLITTRNEEILHFRECGVYIHKARVLTAEQSWNLFSKIVRSEWDGVRSLDEESEFAKLGKEMLETCRGLPLAIVALAGLLSTKWFTQDWKALKNRVTSAILGQNKDSLGYGSVENMLELSYLDLPYDLKPCFIYLGIFPEDTHIDVEKLILLWIGEGLIRTDMCSEDETLEELSMDLVDKLVRRCMVQVVSWNYKGKAKKIRLHDLMRDLCLRKAKELEFFEIESQLATTSVSKNSLSRRAIIYGLRGSQSTFTSHLRSIVQTASNWARNGNLGIAYEKMKLLRVLHLTRVCLGDSAPEIGNLILLRYLHIEKCMGVATAVLKSVKRLVNLLNLVLMVDEVIMPNNMVGSMKQLRYLFVEGGEVRFDDLLGVGGSRSLQCLQLSSAGEWLSKELHAAAFILTLRTLSLQGINSQAQLDSAYGFVSNPSNNLRVLMLGIDTEVNLEFDLEGMKLESCQHLEDITLDGRLKRPLSLPHNILSLVLMDSKIEKVDDLERALSQLHELRRLTLWGCVFEGNTLTMTGLLQLQRLKLFNMKNLRECIIDEGSLEQLKKLDITYCGELRRIPQGIGHIPQLQQIIVDGMPSSFIKRLERPSEMEDSSKGGGGEDFHLICHVPNIKFFKRTIKSMRTHKRVTRAVRLSMLAGGIK